MYYIAIYKYVHDIVDIYNICQNIHHLLIRLAGYNTQKVKE